MSHITDIENRGIYSDLLRKFRSEGWSIYIVTPHERSLGVPTELVERNGAHILGVKTLNLQKTNVVEKGVGQVLVEGQFKRAIKRHFSDVQFDLILYSTPPITLTNVVSYLKRRNPKAVSYLLLKDIFPQNAVDIGMFSEGSLFNKYFRRKEVALYKVSDYIGCMSPANVEFLLKHNDYLDREEVEVAPNSISLIPDAIPAGAPPRNLSPNGDGSVCGGDEERTKRLTEKLYIRSRYVLPKDKPIFVYGGNLGRPQGIDYLIECLDANKYRTDCHFVVVGNGTEYHKLQKWYEGARIASPRQQEKLNVTLMEHLPKVDYDMLVRSCDVGLIFLDHRFTIPNYPSRLLPYLEYKMPVICATDPNTDIGRIAEENGYGYWCESVKPEDFTALVDKMLLSDRKAMGERGYEFLTKNYLVQNTYEAIVKHF